MSDPTDPSVPVPSDPVGAPGGISPAAAPSSGMPLPPWSVLDAGTRMVAGASIAAALVLLVGGIVDTWSGNTEFLVLGLLAAIVAAAAAWASASPRVVAAIPVPLEIVATLAASIVAVLGTWRLIEVLFDFDELDRYGGVVGLLLTAALAILGLAGTWFALRRDDTTMSALRSTDRSARLALGGLAVVLVGWAIMLASYWTMHAAAVTLTLITIGAAVVLLAGRGLPAIAAWIGVVAAALVVLLAIDQWGQLARFSEGRFDIGVSDLLPFAIYVVGVLLVLAGGVLTGMAAMPRTPTAPATPAPPAPPAAS